METIKKIFHFLLAWAAAFFYGFPAKKMIIIGVTGTKGKSSTCRFIADVLEASGRKVGMLTTIEFQIGSQRILNDKKMTMLGLGQIQGTLKKMVKAGCELAVIETSSQGILQYRHIGLFYDISVFTNLAREHVEAHGGFGNLKKDKGRIFATLSRSSRKKINGKAVQKIIVANSDDPNSEYFLSFDADQKLSYGLNGACSEKNGRITAQDVRSENGMVKFGACGYEFELGVIGEFNVYNALAAICIARALNITNEKIAEGLKKSRVIEGRMEPVNEGQDFFVIIDYAHEPLSLKEMFESLKKMSDTAKIIAVIGSDGGGRDKSKRALMGEISGKYSDFAVISDVNCFDEDPFEIAEMIAAGAEKAGMRRNENLFIEVDRYKGIEKAISLAKPGDIVVITAKGTEQCIVSSGKKIPWDDRKVAREILKKTTGNYAA